MKNGQQSGLVGGTPPYTVRRSRQQMVVDVRQGLTRSPKQLSPKYFYDERGSELFDRICELPEYYPTRTELALMRQHVHDIANIVGPRASVIEFGAGSTLKIRLLLDHL
ncbi:MAG TPA: L-histidine N(alpha)-methyltransferase, partial [Gemmatimonadaceae bacterium]|nr:L-histidine N(alpha)-methyltransferase [Gemmatimonadaceae bacterium]